MYENKRIKFQEVNWLSQSGHLISESQSAEVKAVHFPVVLGVNFFLMFFLSPDLKSR